MPVLDPTFNVIVSEFAPARFLYSDAQYKDFAAMRADYDARGIIAVNVDHSENTIFGAASVNWQFRAWHDMAHIATNAPFTAEGERAAGAYQMEQIRARYGYSADTYRWCAIIDAEVNGQVAYFFEHGEFVTDQFAYAVEYLRARHGLNLPADSIGWRNGFAVSRIQERRAAEIAPAQFGAIMNAYRDSTDADTRARLLVAGAANHTAAADYDGPRGISRTIARITSGQLAATSA